MNNQITRLASQHHDSDYNRLRFGLQGCPIKYLPLSLNFPPQFHELSLRQSHITEHQTAWLLATKSTPVCRPKPAILGPTGIDDLSLDLHDEINSAIEEPLLSQTISNRYVKTSTSHPINISCLMPPELVPVVSSNAVLSIPPSPPVLSISSNFLIHRLLIAQSSYSLSDAFVSSAPVLMKLPLIRNQLTGALEAAISSDLSNSNATSANSFLLEQPTHLADGFAPSISLSLSLQIPVRNSLISVSPLKITSSLEIFSPHRNNGSKDIAAPQPRSASTTYPCLEPENLLTVDPCSEGFLIGNLYMSSCPGKKVRLNGSVRGRSAVCRDLDIDLTRMKDLGIGCIVCCLDNEELEFLGAPWPSYERYAQMIGIDVLRLPIPEGLPPISPEYLDMHLTQLLHNYTLKGMPILVHCRGGVGRAGVVACCWTIKLGLCGWVTDEMYQSPNADNGTQEGDASPSILKFVETVIAFVRRRRSPKAVETFEQVQFLVQYVEFLRDSPTAGSSPLSIL